MAIASWPSTGTKTIIVCCPTQASFSNCYSLLCLECACNKFLCPEHFSFVPILPFSARKPIWDAALQNAAVGWMDCRGNFCWLCLLAQQHAVPAKNASPALKYSQHWNMQHVTPDTKKHCSGILTALHWDIILTRIRAELREVGSMSVWKWQWYV